MAKRKKRFADDGWAVWVSGDDTSTVYINDWLNPKGRSYVDFAVRIVGVEVSKSLHVYVPFKVERKEIEDISLKFNDRNILQATFSSSCLVDYLKNDHTTEIAYNGKTIDVIHISTIEYSLKEVAEGTLIEVDLDSIRSFIDNDEVYIIWRMPHRSLDDVFRPYSDAKRLFSRLRDLITTPVNFEKYGYSIRVNESRRLPEEINKIGALHRQKLKKTVVSITIDENYELNDGNCYRIRRLEENLYKDYHPRNYQMEDAITYQWNQTREDNLMGHFNFYFNISRESISHASMTFYIILLVLFGVAGEAAYDLIQLLIGLF